MRQPVLAHHSIIVSKTQIILATDGSIEADIATAVYQRLPLGDAEITVVTVLRPAPELLDRPAEAGRLEQRIARQMIERIAEHLGGDCLLLEGNPSEELLKLIQEQEPSLVLAGCDLNGTTTAFLRGSVARKLALYSQASVLLGRKFAAPAPEGSCQRIAHKPKLDLLVAYDGSQGSELVLQTLAKLHQPFFGTVYVLSVEPYTYVSPTTDLSLYMPLTDADRKRLQDLAEGACAKIERCADRVEALIDFGSPPAKIEELAQGKAVDLILMGANRHGTLERLILGSCAHEVSLTAPCSVLILRDVLPFAD